MTNFYFDKSIYDFLVRASKCFRGQPDRQYFLEKSNDNERINYLLLKDDPCRVMARPTKKQCYDLYDNATHVGAINEDILFLFCINDANNIKEGHARNNPDLLDLAIERARINEY